jgi:gamma-glutamyltranspeptidase/glutathione hydrolase
MLQMLAILKNTDIADLDPAGAAFVHLFVEAAKLAFADREAWYGDPDFVEVPMERLLSASYNETRRRLITEVASRELRPGSPHGRLPKLPLFQDPPPNHGIRGKTRRPGSRTSRRQHQSDQHQ